jgi:citrate lyase subunit beta/citryl-CoA lyase
MSDERRTQGAKGPRLRTALFVPGNNARAIEKARELACDSVILDLEDAVGAGEKAAARASAADAISARAFGASITVVRINALTSALGVDDLKAARGADAILLPKVDSVADLAAARLLAGATPLWAMIETPAAVLALPAIAQGAAALVLGANDLLKDMGARHVAGRANLTYAMSALVTAARAHGALALDSVHNDIADIAGFESACTMARDFGFDGKSLIHPAQIAPARAAFAPSPDDVERSRRLLAAFELPENRGRGVIAFEGRMVERLDAEMAQAVLDEAAG